NNYDKRNFRRAADGLTAETYRGHLLGDERKQDLLLKKEAEMLEAVPLPAFDLPALNGQTTARLKELLGKRVASQALAELSDEPDVARWVQRGLDLHKGTHQTDTCRFCGEPFTADRRDALEAHFNDAFLAFQATLAEEI